MDSFGQPALDPISHEIWDMKYRLKNRDGTPVDQTIEESWRRVADAVALAEPEDRRKKQSDEFYRILENYRFLPAGRILAGAGTGRQVTLFNWFVMGTINSFLPKNKASAGPSKPPPVNKPSQFAKLVLKASLFIGFIFTLAYVKGVFWCLLNTCHCILGKACKCLNSFLSSIAGK